MKVTVVTFAAIWPILLNTRAGVRALDPVLLDTGRSLHLGWFDSTRKLLLPALMPAILLGVRVGAPVSLVITLLVEILTRVVGLGALIAQGQRDYLPSQVYGLILVAGLFSFLVNGLVAAVETSIFRNRPPVAEGSRPPNACATATGTKKATGKPHRRAAECQTFSDITTSASASATWARARSGTRRCWASRSSQGRNGS